MKLLNVIARKSFDEIKSTLENPPYNCNVNEDGNLYIVKYNQIKSDFSIKAVQEARGIILEKGTNKIIARAFDKFFNYSEGHAELIDFSTAKVQEKVDGSCDGDTLILTEIGYKKIKDIVENNEKISVLTYDIENEKEEFDEIVGFSEKENNDDWYEIELENEEIIKLTGNHLVYLPKLKCYRKVEELTGNEEVLFL